MTSFFEKSYIYRFRFFHFQTLFIRSAHTTNVSSSFSYKVRQLNEVIIPIVMYRLKINKSRIIQVSAITAIALTVLCNNIVLWQRQRFRFRYSFICQDTSTRRQQSDLFGLRVKQLPATTSLSTQR